MPLYIKNDEVAALVAQLAARKGISKQEAVKIAVEAELGRLADTTTLGEKFAALRTKYPLPPPTGERADKAFFDELSGDL